MPAGQVPAAPAGPAAGSMAGMPIDITCRGPFRFDLVRRLATFDSDVKVARMRPTGPGDLLTCDRLSIVFTKKPGHAGAEAANDRGGAFDLDPHRLEAVGSPLVLDAPADKVRASGEEMQYDFQASRILLRGAARSVAR